MFDRLRTRLGAFRGSGDYRHMPEDADVLWCLLGLFGRILTLY